MTLTDFTQLAVPAIAVLAALTSTFVSLFAVRVASSYKETLERSGERTDIPTSLALKLTLAREGMLAGDSLAWAEVVRKTEHGEAIAVLDRGAHVADVVASGELDRLRETVDVLSDSDLVRDLLEGLDDARAGRVVSSDDIAADIAARRNAGER